MMDCVAFENFGEVVSAEVVMDRVTGRRGFGFVTYSDVESAEMLDNRCTES